MPPEWYKITNEAEIPSPAILLFPERIRENIQRMIAIAGSTDRLRPHVKTHKLPQVIQMQVEAGISKFKCATLSEAKMVAENGGKDILVAYPLYGPSVSELFQLVKKYPDTRFSAIVDNFQQAGFMEAAAHLNKTTLDVFLDLDIGMERTGIKPGTDARDLYLFLAKSTSLRPRGLHVYDGHIHQADPQEREANCEAYFEKVNDLLQSLEKEGIQPEELICGGTPTFPIHAKQPERTLSPGTVLLWDWGYSTKFLDLNFYHAAVLFTRIVSKPGKNKLCLDLGHKAVASEMSPPRVHFLGIPAYEQVGHSEEHLVISFDGAERFSVGDGLYAIPMHICPTMALHDFVWTVSENEAKEKWQVTARTREINNHA